MAEMVALADKELIIRHISSIFPSSSIYAFGSRIKETARQYSDLDLAIEDKTTLPLGKISQLQELFAESSLPYKVDIVDFLSIDAEFKEIIKTSCHKWK